MALLLLLSCSQRPQVVHDPQPCQGRRHGAHDRPGLPTGTFHCRFQQVSRCRFKNGPRTEVCLCVHRLTCSLSPCSPGPEWADACWTAVKSLLEGNLFWREFLRSSMVPCSAAQPRTHWAPQTHTLASLCLVSAVASKHSDVTVSLQGTVAP